VCSVGVCLYDSLLVQVQRRINSKERSTVFVLYPVGLIKESYLKKGQWGRGAYLWFSVGSGFPLYHTWCLVVIKNAEYLSLPFPTCLERAQDRNMTVRNVEETQFILQHRACEVAGEGFACRIL
jgi:hypothetical protein